MKSKSVMLLVVAAGCGLVAMMGVQQMMSRGGQNAPKIRIAIAKTEIQAGIKLDEENVGVKELPPEAVPEGAVTRLDEYADRALKHRLAAGQPILLSELGKKGEYGLDIQIPPDMRLASVSVNSTMTHSGLLKPGSFVDVNAAVEVPIKGGGRRTEVKPVLQCVQVFAIDSQVLGSEESKDPKAKDVKNVTFLVYPRQAMLLHLASKQSNGGLQFTSRSSSDKTIVNTGDLNEDSLNQLSNALVGYKDEPEHKENKEVDNQPSAKPRSAFRSYVAPETSSAVASVGEQAARRTWKIEIYQGDHLEVQELDWPEDVTRQSRENSDEPLNPASNPLLKFFNRRQKAQTAEEQQSTTMIRKNDPERLEQAERQPGNGEGRFTQKE